LKKIRKPLAFVSALVAAVGMLSLPAIAGSNGSTTYDQYYANYVGWPISNYVCSTGTASFYAPAAASIGGTSTTWGTSPSNCVNGDFDFPTGYLYVQVGKLHWNGSAWAVCGATVDGTNYPAGHHVQKSQYSTCGSGYYAGTAFSQLYDGTGYFNSGPYPIVSGWGTWP
jgi:hypothetical protein